MHVIDGTVNGIAAVTQGARRGIRQIQTGRVQNYALGIAAGLIVVAVGYVVAVRPLSDERLADPDASSRSRRSSARWSSPSCRARTCS